MKIAKFAFSTIEDTLKFNAMKRYNSLFYLVFILLAMITKPYTVAPVCRPGQKTIYSGGRQEMIKISCELEANPYNVTFNWKFNASATEFLDLPASQIFPERNNAVAQYTPMTEHVSIIHILP